MHDRILSAAAAAVANVTDVPIGQVIDDTEVISFGWWPVTVLAIAIISFVLLTVSSRNE